MEDGWRVVAYSSVTLVNQLDASSSVKRGGKDTFQKGYVSWGWSRFVSLVGLHDPGKGYLVNDTLIVEAEVSTKAAESEAAAKDEPKVQDGPISTPLTSRNLIAQMASMTGTTSHVNSSSNPDHQASELLQRQREKLVGFLGMSLEAICQIESLDEVENIARQVAENAADPTEKIVLKDLISRFTEFKETALMNSLLAVETSSAAESSVTRMTKDMEARLVHRKTQLSSLEAEVSRLGEEDMKLEGEMQQLAARRAKIAEQRNSTVVELEKASREASKEVEELKKRYDEREEAIENRMRVKDGLALSNASWKLFKEHLGW